MYKLSANGYALKIVEIC